MKSFPFTLLTPVNCRLSVVLGFLVLLSYGCKDDDGDTESPRVILDQPFENQVINSVDTIDIAATVTDETNLAYIEVDLLNLDFESVITSQRFPVSGTEVQFAQAVVINAPLIPGGQYYIAVRASDGSNRASAYAQVLVIALPRAVDQFIAITSGTNSTKIFKGETLNSWTQSNSLFFDFNGATLNYRQNIIALAGGEIGDALFYDSESAELINSFPGYGIPSFPYFLGVDYDPSAERFILLQNEPRARVIDKNANPLYAAELLQDYLPVRSFDRVESYYVLERHRTMGNYVLNNYSNAGLLLQSTPLSGEAKGVFKKNTSEEFVWENAGEGAKLSILTGNNLLSPIFVRTGESLKAVVQIAQGVFVFSTDQGIYRYNYNNGGTVVLNNSFFPDQLVYDPVDGFLYAFDMNALYRLSENAVIISSYTFSDQIVYFGLDYNR